MYLYMCTYTCTESSKGLNFFSFAVCISIYLKNNYTYMCVYRDIHIHTNMFTQRHGYVDISAS